MNEPRRKREVNLKGLGFALCFAVILALAAVTPRFAPSQKHKCAKEARNVLVKTVRKGCK